MCVSFVCGRGERKNISGIVFVVDGHCAMCFDTFYVSIVLNLFKV